MVKIWGHLFGQVFKNPSYHRLLGEVSRIFVFLHSSMWLCGTEAKIQLPLVSRSQQLSSSL